MAQSGVFVGAMRLCILIQYIILYLRVPWAQALSFSLKRISVLYVGELSRILADLFRVKITSPSRRGKG